MKRGSTFALGLMVATIAASARDGYGFGVLLGIAGITITLTIERVTNPAFTDAGRGTRVSAIQRQTPEWRIAKALKAGIPREWLDNDGYIRREFGDATDALIGRLGEGR